MQVTELLWDLLVMKAEIRGILTWGNSPIFLTDLLGDLDKISTAVILNRFTFLSPGL